MVDDSSLIRRVTTRILEGRRPIFRLQSAAMGRPGGTHVAAAPFDDSRLNFSGFALRGRP
jgi:hypothetical protein